MSESTSASVVAGFIDLATYDEIEDYLYAHKGAVTYFVRATMKSTWFTQIPVPLTSSSGQARFGKEISYHISRAGDYLLNTWMRVKLNKAELIPQLSSGTKHGNDTIYIKVNNNNNESFVESKDFSVRYTTNLMHNLVKKIKLKFNDLSAHEVKSHHMDFYRNFSISKSKRQGYNMMIGNRPEVSGWAHASKTEQNTLGDVFLNLPLPLFYENDSGSALPTAALPYNDMRLHLELNRWEDLVVIDKFGLGGSVDGKLYKQVSTDDFAQVGSNISKESNSGMGNRTILSNDGLRVAVVANESYESKGHVSVYEWNSQNSTWVQLGTDIIGEATGDLSGHSFSMSGNGSRIAISSILNNGNGVNAGHVRVYEWGDGAWVQLGSDIDGVAFQGLGWSINLSNDGSRIAIGSPFTSGVNAIVYEWSNGSWVQLGNSISGEDLFAFTGWSVCLSGDGSRVAIGETLNDGNGTDSGHVRVYEWGDGAWVQLGLDIDGEAPFDQSGFSVSLSSDGSRVAIGAQDNDGNGNNAGHVRIYEWDSISWNQMGNDLDGDTSLDNFGYSIDLSSDGTCIAVGAPRHDSNSGQVKIFKWENYSWVQIGNIKGVSGETIGLSVCLSGDGTKVAIESNNNVKVYEQGSLTYQEVVLTNIERIETSDKRKYFKTGSEPKLENVELWANYAIISKEERERMGKHPRNMVIEQVQHAPDESFELVAGVKKTYDLRFSHSVKAIFFGVKNLDMPGELSNYTNESYPNPWQAIHAPYFPAKNIIRSASLIYENTRRLGSMGVDYFTLVNPYYHAESDGTDQPGVCLYSYSLDLMNRDPMGSTNFGKLTNISLVPISDVDRTNKNSQFLVTVINFNIVRIAGGSLGFPIL